MLLPTDGLTGIAEFPTKFEADVTAAHLQEAGFPATIVGCQTRAWSLGSVPPGPFTVLVRDGDSVLARDLLIREGVSPAFMEREPVHLPSLVTWLVVAGVTILLLVVIVGAYVDRGL